MHPTAFADLGSFSYFSVSPSSFNFFSIIFSFYVVSWVDLDGHRSVFMACCYKYLRIAITRSIFLHSSYVILIRSPTNALGCGPFGSSSCDSQTHHHSTITNFACCGHFLRTGCMNLTQTAT